jgi:hypothetical protein
MATEQGKEKSTARRSGPFFYSGLVLTLFDPVSGSADRAYLALAGQTLRLSNGSCERDRHGIPRRWNVF